MSKQPDKDPGPIPSEEQWAGRAVQDDGPDHICAVTLSDGTMVQLQDAADLIEQRNRAVQDDGLDVERLARALERFDWAFWEDTIFHHPEKRTEAAKAISAMYRAAPTGPDGDGSCHEAVQDDGLDVALLGEAWGNVMDGRRVEGVRLHPGITTSDDWLVIAAEYARLRGAAPALHDPETER